MPLTLWTRDCAAADPDQNTYGSWPFLIDVRQGVPSDLHVLKQTLSWRGSASPQVALSEKGSGLLTLSIRDCRLQTGTTIRCTYSFSI